jgi:hypothetical protein
MVFKPSRPSVGSTRKKEGQNPRAVNQIGTRPPGRWDNARRSTAPAPQSKPVTPASRLVAQVRAVGGIRARAENPGRRASSICDSTPIAGVCNVIICRVRTRARLLPVGGRLPPHGPSRQPPARVGRRRAPKSAGTRDNAIGSPYQPGQPKLLMRACSAARRDQRGDRRTPHRWHGSPDGSRALSWPAASLPAHRHRTRKNREGSCHDQERAR